MPVAARAEAAADCSSCQPCFPVAHINMHHPSVLFFRPLSTLPISLFHLEVRTRMLATALVSVMYWQSCLASCCRETSQSPNLKDHFYSSFASSSYSIFFLLPPFPPPLPVLPFFLFLLYHLPPSASPSFPYLLPQPSSSPLLILIFFLILLIFLLLLLYFLPNTLPQPLSSSSFYNLPTHPLHPYPPS